MDLYDGSLPVDSEATVLAAKSTRLWETSSLSSTSSPNCRAQLTTSCGTVTQRPGRLHV